MPSVLSKPALGSVPLKERWRPWSTPITGTTLSRRLCGLLNKVTMFNLDLISYCVADLVRTVEMSGDVEKLDNLVGIIFRRGVTEECHQALYASLLCRTSLMLEEERRRWIRAHKGGDFAWSFEACIGRLAKETFQRVYAAHAPGELERLLSFLGALLAQHVLVTDDLLGTLTALVDAASSNDETCAVALCRFLSCVTFSPDAPSTLRNLQAQTSLERILREESLSSKIRYMILNMLARVLRPVPRDVPQSMHTRDEIEPDVITNEEGDSNDSAPLDDDETDDEEWIRRDCQDWARSYLYDYDQHLLTNILHSLRTEHRQRLIRCLVSTALYAGDTNSCQQIGLLYTVQQVRSLCKPGDVFSRALADELSVLPDTSLDVPDACSLMANILLATSIPMQDIKNMIQESLPATDTSQHVLDRLSTLIDSTRCDARGSVEERLNRFERSSSGGSQQATHVSISQCSTQEL